MASEGKFPIELFEEMQGHLNDYRNGQPEAGVPSGE
jgi:hypothetical protein